MIVQNHQVFGRFPGSHATTTAPQGESLATSGTAYRRKVRGPCEGGRYGFTAIPSGGATASMTVWYSHLPNPDPTVDTHWFQDTDLGTVTLTSGTTLGRMVGNAHATWVRFAVTVTAGTLTISLWVDNGGQ